MKAWIGALAIGMLAQAAAAEALTGKEAKKVLFAPVQAEVEIMPEAGLPADQAKMLEQVAVGQPYFGAIAISPDDGLMSEATFAAANYHDTAAASVAALAECNDKKAGKADCVIAALIRPKGWKGDAFGLSSDATAAFSDYDRQTGALAISVTTGAWGLAAGDGAAEKAVAACAAKNKLAVDCAVAIAN